MTRISGLFAAVLASLITHSCDDSLNRGLEEEKSYTRHAMEYHRSHPDKRAGDRVLETWSTADYIAQTVRDRKISGNWSQWSDQMLFLTPAIQHDQSGQPFCVIQRHAEILVIDYFQPRPPTCGSIPDIDRSLTRSGDMQFSGRTDYWVYVLKME